MTKLEKKAKLKKHYIRERSITFKVQLSYITVSAKHFSL